MYWSTIFMIGAWFFGGENEFRTRPASCLHRARPDLVFPDAREILRALAKTSSPDFLSTGRDSPVMWLG